LENNSSRSFSVSPFSGFHRGEKARISNSTGETCRMYHSAANQTPTASVANSNQDQIPLHSMIGLNDGFTT